MAVYNCEKYIEAAVKSVLAQTENNFEIIAVNDGSTDSTVLILDALATADSRIKVINQPNSGRPAIPRNAGISAAGGEFIAFLDGDDLYHPEKIATLLNVMAESPEVDLVFHDFRCINEDGKPNEETYLQAAGFHISASSTLQLLSSGDYRCTTGFYNYMSVYLTSLHTSSVLIRKSRLDMEAVWFPEELLIGEDIDLWFRLVKGGKNVFVDEVLSFYRQHGESITRDDEKTSKGFIAAHKRNYLRGGKLFTSEERLLCKRRLASECFHLGYHYSINHRSTDARQAFMDSFSWSPSVAAVKGYLKTWILP